MNFLTIETSTIHYKDEGARTGECLLFLNSLGTDLRIWDDVVPAFHAAYRIIRMDKRGHGMSDAPQGPYSIPQLARDVLALIDHLGIEKATLIGDSVGGMIALAFAIEWPERVSRLVLCDTAAKIGQADYWNERIAALRQSGIEPIADGVLERWFSPQYIANNRAGYAGYRNMLTRTPLAGYIGVCEAIRDADMREAAQRVEIPTLVVCGAQDRATPPEMVRGLAERMPNAEFLLIENAGHIPSIEQPQALSNGIETFLKEIK